MPTWIALFMEFFIPMIQGCIEDGSARKTRKRLRKPGRREFVVIATKLREEKGWTGRKLRKRTRAVMLELELASDKEIDQLMACGTAASKSNAG